jgi:hypothetical protein
VAQVPRLRALPGSRTWTFSVAIDAPDARVLGPRHGAAHRPLVLAVVAA